MRRDSRLSAHNCHISEDYGSWASNGRKPTSPAAPRVILTAPSLNAACKYFNVAERMLARNMCKTYMRGCIEECSYKPGSSLLHKYSTVLFATFGNPNRRLFSYVAHSDFLARHRAIWGARRNFSCEYRFWMELRIEEKTPSRGAAGRLVERLRIRKFINRADHACFSV